ncbi:hypothetical protein [uncultured Pseudomonas sp.]|uniref:hypothetical protein n=1 Tax=uncultured Pseudomonas sp. TaxID=114707 RepID=UPI00258E01AC|nr:hypothetical protein [uncultured Pseudomonas sp.]
MTDEVAMYQQWHLWITEAAVEAQRRRVQLEFAEYSRLLADLQLLEQQRWQQALPVWLRVDAEMVSTLKH